MEVTCEICNALFKTKPYFVRKGQGRFCSKVCKGQSQKKGAEIPCSVCAKPVYRNSTQTGKSKSHKFFCSKSCQTKWRNSQYTGQNHIGWKDGKSTYRDILTRSGVSRVCFLCKETDRRVLVVHHIDEDRSNNRLENLSWLCHNCHHLVHRDRAERQQFRKMIAG